MNNMWSIGIYTGQSPFNLTSALRIANPVLTFESVTDVPAEFVADPFMIPVAGVWYMFFEVLNRQTNKGEIGLATSSDGLAWNYRQIVLTEPFHLSYPYVFECRGDFYMVPETLEANKVSLYKSTSFPTDWSYVGELVHGRCADPSIFHFNQLWWMFACSTPYLHDTLRLYFAPELTGPWTEHPNSPIVAGNKVCARPAGRVVVLDDKIVRFSQDCVPEYGTRVRAFEISQLTTTRYLEAEHQRSPVLTASSDRWNGMRMHHIDPHFKSDGEWIACVDGYGVVSD